MRLWLLVRERSRRRRTHGGNNQKYSSTVLAKYSSACVCVCVFFPFILDVRLLDVPDEVTQEEGHT